MIAQMSGQVASVSFSRWCSSPRQMSVSIGLLNLFPVPLLDGGHLLFYAIEAVRGRPLSERAQEYGFRIGMALVLMLMVFATYNDIARLASRWAKRLRHDFGGLLCMGNGLGAKDGSADGLVCTATKSL